MGRLDGKRVIITGGGTGIGKAAAILMAREGARVVVAGRRQAALDEVVQTISAASGTAFAIPVDLESETSIAEMVATAAKQMGGIDTLVSNAALTDPAALMADGPITQMDTALWDRTMAVNLRGAMLCCKHTIPHILAASGGAIVFSSSGKSLQGDLDNIAYGASKAALNNMMRYIATQYGKQGIRANAAVIGLVLTEALEAGLPEPVQKMIAEHHLTPAIGTPEQVAEVIAFLASDAAAFVTGAAVPVDGGVTCHSPFYADTLRARAASV